jgi:hypothetical protein
LPLLGRGLGSGAQQLFDGYGAIQLDIVAEVHSAILALADDRDDAIFAGDQTFSA